MTLQLFDSREAATNEIPWAACSSKVRSDYQVVPMFQKVAGITEKQYAIRCLDDEGDDRWMCQDGRWYTEQEMKQN